ncbi:ComEA family DNA-binding protein [Paenibacillus hexagrammi]|uniref:Helix-hairpin-helix domain-containing protein n=1 Tax=Paenibacillus hexagrammi TaxID=2908839 RepID=A0ABY3SMB8_9BACL|nr:ComEA family DNA-binding protein [Paenibacillus sp. YPD9-1]UJF35028.1 helix-hairpin-helix domain-containing protein [Paenibacillus sp. YPD9-1]
MAFFGKRGILLMLLVISIGLFGIALWQFVSGGRSQFQMPFIPVNEQMQMLLDPSQIETNGAPEPTKSSQSSKDTTEFMDMDQASKDRVESKGVSSGESSMQQNTSQFGDASNPSYPSDTINPANPTNPIDTTAPSNASKASTNASLLDLNTATIEQLDALPGIGASKAKAIIEYRSKIGRYARVEQLTDVKGIGEKMLQKLKPLVMVAEP